MATELLWKTGEFYSKIYQTLWKAPITYNPQIHRLTFVTDPKQFRAWTLVIFISSLSYFSFLMAGLSILIQSNKPIPKSVSLPSLLGCLVCFSIFVSPFLAKYGSTVCYSLNQGAGLEESFLQRHPNCKPFKKRDYLGITLLFAVVFSGFIPIFYSLAESVTGYLLFNAFFEKKSYGLITICIIIFRKVTLYIMVYEFCRIVFGILLIAIMCMEAGYFVLCQFSSHGEKAILKCDTRSIDYYFHTYKAFVILVQIVEKAAAFVVGCLMSGGMFGCVCCNFVTLKMRVVIPKPYYYFFPAISVVILSMVSFTLPQAVKFHEKSDSLVKSWRVSAGLVPKEYSRYLRRKMGALRALNIPVGVGNFHLFWLTNKTRRAYYTALNDATINMLLTF